MQWGQLPELNGAPSHNTYPSLGLPTRCTSATMLTERFYTCVVCSAGLDSYQCVQYAVLLRCSSGADGFGGKALLSLRFAH